MASNKQLKDRAEALGKDLGLSVDTSGKGNQALEELVAELEALAAMGEPSGSLVPPSSDVTTGDPPAVSADLSTASDEGSGGAAASSTATPATGEQSDPFDPSARHHVVRGKVVTTIKGPIGGGERVLASDLFAGEAALRELLRAGAVTQS